MAPCNPFGLSDGYSPKVVFYDLGLELEGVPQPQRTLLQTLVAPVAAQMEFLQIFQHVSRLDRIQIYPSVMPFEDLNILLSFFYVIVYNVHFPVSSCKVTHLPSPPVHPKFIKRN